MANKKLSKYSQSANTQIGQHFLINETILSLIAQQVPSRSNVLEIGSGPGQLTTKLINKAQKVVAVEVDLKFKNNLVEIGKGKNIEFVFEDALKIKYSNYKNFVVVGNIPYHITEPLIILLAKAKLRKIILLVGESFANEVMAVRNNTTNFGKLSLIVNAFFDPKVIATLEKEDFNPAPRTKSALIVFEPLNENLEVWQYIVKQLVITSKFSSLTKNSLMEAIIRYHRPKVTTKNEARAIIKSLDISKAILEKPFDQLKNSDYLSLFKSLQNMQI